MYNSVILQFQYCICVLTHGYIYVLCILIYL